MKSFFQKCLQFVKFSLIGCINTVISLGTYYTLTVMFHVYYQYANLAGFLLGTLNGYILNKCWTFRSKSISNLKSAVKFYFSYLMTYTLSVLLLRIEIEYFEISSAIAPILNICITLPINYLLSKIWVFRENGEHCE